MSHPSSNLSEKQQLALEKSLNGHNVFITGGAGVGKSFLTKTIVNGLRDQGQTVRVTASTGVASSLINGQTLHSLLGLGLAQDPVDVLVRRATKNRKVCQVWRNLDVLVIDEISMLHPVFFEKVSKVVAAIRNQWSEPFGGLQLILVGDFYQLPPVPERGQSPTCPKFVFETETWKELNLHCVELTQIFRQEDDSEFAQTLRRIRMGELSDGDEDMLIDRIHAHIEHAEGVIPTKLHSKRANVSELNHKHLMELDGDESKTYEYSVQHSLADGVDERSAQVKAAMKKYVEEVKSNSRVEPSVELRVGAQVMMLVNKPDLRLVNGSRGVVTGFEYDPETGKSYPKVRFSRTTTVVTPHVWTYSREHVGEVMISQVPLQHAWAVTIHKSQGMTLDCAEIALDKGVFEYGQAYVALSRVKSLEGVKIVKFQKRVIRADPKVTEFYNSLDANE